MCPVELTGWSGAVDKLPFEGRRHLPEQERRQRKKVAKVTDFRLAFLKSLKPDHPLYDTPEARAARGDASSE